MQGSRSSETVGAASASCLRNPILWLADREAFSVHFHSLGLRHIVAGMRLTPALGNVASFGDRRGAANACSNIGYLSHACIAIRLGEANVIEDGSRVQPGLAAPLGGQSVLFCSELASAIGILVCGQAGGMPHTPSSVGKTGG